MQKGASFEDVNAEEPRNRFLALRSVSGKGLASFGLVESFLAGCLPLQLLGGSSRRLTF